MLCVVLGLLSELLFLYVGISWPLLGGHALALDVSRLQGSCLGLSSPFIGVVGLVFPLVG